MPFIFGTIIDLLSFFGGYVRSIKGVLYLTSTIVIIDKFSSSRGNYC
jgi:hypothetical protein